VKLFFGRRTIKHDGISFVTVTGFYNYRTVFFGVYKCWGAGAEAVRGVSLARDLDFETAHPFIRKSFVNGRHWIAPSDA